MIAVDRVLDPGTPYVICGNLQSDTSSLTSVIFAEHAGGASLDGAPIAFAHKSEESTSTRLVLTDNSPADIDAVTRWVGKKRT